YIIGIAGLADITIEVLLGKSRDGEARWENDDQVRIEYSIDNGPFQIAGLFTGNNPAAGVGGELLEDTDQNPGTFGPFGTALTDVFTNFSWTVQGSGTNLEFRVVVLSNGTEEVAFDKICISTALACLNDTTNVSAGTCDPGQVGIVQQTLTNFCGADSIVITTTTLLPSDTTNVASTTCDPGQVGVVQQTFTNQFGCDSIVLTTTTLLPSDTTNVAETTCDPGQVGVVQQTFTNQFGCDSIVLTTTTLLPSDTTNVPATTCDPGQVGVVQQTFTNQFGCDSIVLTTTTLLPSDTTNVASTTCDPGQVGVVQQTFTNQFGCDSIVLTTTTLLPSDTTNVPATTCDPGQVGVVQQTLTNQFGCDSIVLTTTTLLPSDTTNVAETTCDPGQVGVVQQTLTNQFGCDSIVLTTTTLLPSDTTNVAETTCDPGQVGVVQQTLTNQFGCDSIVLTTTTLLPSDTTNVASTTCDPGQVGVVQQTFTNQFGCDSIVLTTTTLLPSDTTNVASTTCDPGQVGVVQQTFTNQFGCDSIVITTTTLLPLPDAGSDNSTTVCEGTVVDLQALISAPGGSFEDPTASGGLSGSDFNTTGLPPGNYNLLYIVASGNICDDDTATITVTVEPNIEETCVINTYDTSHPDDHVFVFFDFPKAAGGTYLAARFVWDNTPGQLTVNANGTATISGKVKLKQDNNVKFDVNILLENRMDWPTWSGLGRTYAYKPATQAVASLEHVNWDYYEMSAVSNLVGCAGSTYDGDLISLTHKPADYSMGFQVGFAANEKDDDKGIAGWFFYSGTLGGVSVSDWGDMNADLDCSFSNCVDCTVDFTTVNSPEICNGTGGGSITVNASGGSGVYDFSEDGGTTWITGTGSNSHTFSNLSGMIDLRVRDANDLNCRSDIRYIDLTGPSPDFTTSTVNVSCAENTDGSIDVNVVAGNGPFMYAINGSAFVGSGNTHTFSGLAADDHTIQVKDANGCLSDIRTVTTGTNNPPAFDVSITHESSPGANDGAITVTVTSGVPSFLFSNDNGTTLVPGVGNTHIFTGLAIGVYDLIVEDGNGCQSTRLPAFVSGANFCPPASVIDDLFTAHPGNDGKNARFMCEDQSPHLLYEVTGLAGGSSIYLDWEVSGFQGKATGDRPTVDGMVPATDGSVGGTTTPVSSNAIHTFDANGKVFGLEDNVNSMRRISLAVQPYFVNGTVSCPANPDTWKVYIYKRAKAELDNAIVPGTAIVINSGDDPTGSISIDQTANIKENSNGTLIYDLHIDPNPDITELASGLDLSNVGLSENDDSDNDFEDIDLGLTSLTNTSGGAVTVTVEVTPKFDPNHSRAADKDPINNPNGYCDGATQTIDIIVNSASPRKANTAVLLNGKSVNFRLYPNPADTYFFLQASAVLEQAQKFEITNMLGQILMKGQIEAGAAREKVEVQNLSAGIYLVRITNEQGPDALIRFEKMH
ncbi:MAG: T9SS type A sorting domain-containing protein, partial [Bacteroidota bacterium]